MSGGADLGVSVGARAGLAENSEPDLFEEVSAEVEAAAARGGVIAPPAKRGAGRPKGSGDRKTLAMFQILRAKGYADPMERLAALASSDPVTLGDAMCEGLSLKPEQRLTARIKAGQMIAKAASDLMPYAYRRLPQELEVSGQVETRTLFVIADATKQNQGLSARVVGVSDGDASDGEE